MGKYLDAMRTAEGQTSGSQQPNIPSGTTAPTSGGKYLQAMQQAEASVSKITPIQAPTITTPKPGVIENVKTFFTKSIPEFFYGKPASENVDETKFTINKDLVKTYRDQVLEQNKSIDDQIKEKQKQLQLATSPLEIVGAVKQPASREMFAQGMREQFGTGGITATSVEAPLMSEIDNLKTIKKENQKAIDLYNQVLEEKQADVGFFRSLYNEFKKPLTLVPFGPDIEGLINTTATASALAKYSNGENLSQIEQSALNIYRAESLKKYINDGLGNDVAATIAGVPRFALEMYLTGGLFSTGKTIVMKSAGPTGAKILAKELALKSGEEVAEFTIKENAVRLVANLIGNGFRLPAFSPRISNKTAEYMLPEFGIVNSPEGQQTIDKINEGDSFNKAVSKAGLTTYIDIISEDAGSIIDEGLPFIQKSILSKYISKNGIKTATEFSKLADKLSWDSILGEVFEEEISYLLQAPVEGYQYKDPFTTPEGRERLLVETLGIAPFGGISTFIQAKESNPDKLKKNPNDVIDISDLKPTDKAFVEAADYQKQRQQVGLPEEQLPTPTITTATPTQKPQVPTTLQMAQAPIPTLEGVPTPVTPAPAVTPTPTPASIPTPTATKLPPVNKDIERINKLEQIDKELYKTSGMSVTEKNKKLKGVGMEYAGLKRAVLGQPTDIELNNELKRLNTMYDGKTVTYKGVTGTVVGRAFNTVKVRFDDGSVRSITKSELVTTPATKQDAIDSLKQKALDTIKNKEAVQKQLEQRTAKQKEKAAPAPEEVKVIDKQIDQAIDDLDLDAIAADIDDTPTGLRTVEEKEQAIKDIYKSKEDKVYEALNTILQEMEIAEAGYRFTIQQPKSMDRIGAAMPSTFPKWSEGYNRRELFDRVMNLVTTIEDIKFPRDARKKAERGLLSVIFDEVDKRTNLDTYKYRKEILDEIDGKKEKGYAKAPSVKPKEKPTKAKAKPITKEEIKKKTEQRKKIEDFIKKYAESRKIERYRLADRVKDEATLNRLEKDLAARDILKSDYNNFQEIITYMPLTMDEQVLYTRAKSILQDIENLTGNMVIEGGKRLYPPKSVSSIQERISRLFNEQSIRRSKAFRRGMVSYRELQSMVTTKLLNDLKGRNVVKKSFVEQRLRSKDLNLKQVEINLVNNVLKEYGDTVDVFKFTNDVTSKLLPLDVISGKNIPTFVDTQRLERIAQRSGRNEDWQRYYDANEEYSAGELSGGRRYNDISIKGEARGKVKNYFENIYTSPANTEAGRVHFPGLTDSYFGHTRIEDMADGKTRRVIEVQSDLYQKDRLDKESENITELRDRISAVKSGQTMYKGEDQKKMLDSLTQRLEQAIITERQSKELLAQYQNPTAHFRMIREEIKKAAEDGKQFLLFPTGETAMNVEGLVNRADKWVTLDNKEIKDGTEFDIGDVISIRDNEGNVHSWRRFIVTKNNMNGTFEAVDTLSIENDPKGYEATSKYRDQETGDITLPKKVPESVINNIKHLSEQLSAKDTIDRENPIYKFYEKELQKYIKREYKATDFTDTQGITWYKVEVDPNLATIGVEAFRVKDDVKEITGIDITDAQEKEIIDLNNRFFKDNNIRFTLQIWSNKDALGSTYNDMIKIVKGQVNPKDTFYHEAVHKYLNIFSTQEELVSLFEAGIKKYKTNDLNVVEEQIAEDFIRYAKNREGISGKIRMVFDSIFEKIKTYLNHKNEIESLYNSILFGKKAKEVQKVKKITTKPEVAKGKAESAFQKRISEQLLATDPAKYALDETTGTYNVKSLEKSANQAANFLIKNPEEAVAISLGIKPAPEGMEGSAISVATATRALQEGNIPLWVDIINGLSQRLTKAGREIVQVRGTFTDDSPENYIKRVIDAKMNAVASNFVTQAEAMGRKMTPKQVLDAKVKKDVVKLKERLSKEQSNIRSAQEIIDALRC